MTMHQVAAWLNEIGRELHGPRPSPTEDRLPPNPTRAAMLLGVLRGYVGEHLSREDPERFPPNYEPLTD